MRVMATERRKATESAHSQLDRLTQTLAAARVAERDAHVAWQEAQAGVERVKERARQAHAEGTDAAGFGTELRLAREKVEQAGLALEGVVRRVEEARIAHQRYVRDNMRQLQAELDPQEEAAKERVAEAERQASVARAALEAIRATREALWNTDPDLRLMRQRSAA
jgi:hypothetical protein